MDISEHLALFQPLAIQSWLKFRGFGIFNLIFRCGVLGAVNWAWKSLENYV